MKNLFVVLGLILSHSNSYSALSIHKNLLKISSDKPQKSVVGINNFIVKKHLTEHNRIEIMACDSKEKTIETSGFFVFGVNGFKQTLRMKNGIAMIPQAIDQSTFIYLRHANENGICSKLYYLINRENNTCLIKIDWWVLITIPFIILLLGYIFQKFILVSIMLVICMFAFNGTRGFSLPMFLNTLLDGLKNIF